MVMGLFFSVIIDRCGVRCPVLLFINIEGIIDMVNGKREEHRDRRLDSHRH